MSRILHLNPPAKSETDDRLVGEMASALNACGADLADERRVISELSSRRFLSGDIVALVDDAVALARRQRSAGPTVALVVLLVLTIAAPVLAAGSCSSSSPVYFSGDIQ